MSRRTLLLFAHECAPHHRPGSTSAAQRPAAWLRFLPQEGWRVIVICRDADRPPADRRTFREEVRLETETALEQVGEGESVLVSTPELSSDGFIDSAWRQLKDRPSAGTRPLLRLTSTMKWWTGDYSQSWQPCAREAAEVVAGVANIDVVMGTHSPNASLFLARWFARRHGVPWVIEFRDPVLRPFRGVRRGAYAPVLRHLTRESACLIDVHPTTIDAHRELTDRPTVCIPNGFDPGEYEPVVEARTTGPVTVAYLGGVGTERDVRPFLAALRELKDRLGDGAKERIRFVCRGSSEHAWRVAVEEAGVESLVDLGGSVSRAEALDLMKSADLLLLLSVSRSLDPDPVIAGGLLPGKVFEYLAVQRPILCVPGDGGVLDDVLHETRTGVVAQDADAVLEVLERALADREDGRAIDYAPNDEAVAAFARPRLAARLARVLDAVATGADPESAGGES